MDIEELQQLIAAWPYVSEEFPFDEVTLCFKVKGKVFAIAALDNYPLKVNLKAPPEEIPDLIEQYEEVEPGYHMNKKHWITVNFHGRLPKEYLKNLVEQSYRLVVSGMSIPVRKEILSILDTIKQP